MNFSWILLLIAVGLIVYVWSLYNQLVTIRTRIKASIQEIGNQLKRQADLIPNLVSSVKGYLSHEKEVFEMLSEARKSVAGALESGDAQKIVNASQQLQTALTPIRAVFESNPQLRAAEPTIKLMDELRDTADKVMYSRRTLVDLTADFNIKIVTFPSNLVANMLGFKAETGLVVPEEGGHREVDKDSLETPKVDLG